MRKVQGAAALAAVLLCCSNAAAQSYSNRSNQTSFNLPGVQTSGGNDEVRAADGTTCRSSLGHRGAYIDIGGVANGDDGNVGSGAIYGRVIVPLGQRPTRIDCDTLYQLEVERLRLEVASMRRAIEEGESSAGLIEAKISATATFGDDGDDPFSNEGLIPDEYRAKDAVEAEVEIDADGVAIDPAARDGSVVPAVPGINAPGGVNPYPPQYYPPNQHYAPNEPDVWGQSQSLPGRFDVPTSTDVAASRPLASQQPVLNAAPTATANTRYETQPYVRPATGAVPTSGSGTAAVLDPYGYSSQNTEGANQVHAQPLAPLLVQPPQGLTAVDRTFPVDATSAVPEPSGMPHAPDASRAAGSPAASVDDPAGRKDTTAQTGSAVPFSRPGETTVEAVGTDSNTFDGYTLDELEVQARTRALGQPISENYRTDAVSTAETRSYEPAPATLDPFGFQTR